MTCDKGLKVIIIGNGDIVHYVYFPILEDMKHITIVGLCGNNLTKLKQTAQKYAIENYSTTWTDLYKEVDADLVMIALPNHLHFVAAKEALDYGFHLFLEKPAVLSLREGRKIAALAEKQNCHVDVNMSLRFHPAFINLKKLIKENLDFTQVSIEIKYGIGRPNQRWYIDPTLRGSGVLFGAGIHVVDIISFLTNSREFELEFSSIYGHSIMDALSFNMKSQSFTASGIFFWGDIPDENIFNITDENASLQLNLSARSNSWKITKDGLLLANGAMFDGFIRTSALYHIIKKLMQEKQEGHTLTEHLDILSPFLLAYKRLVTE